MKKKKVIKIRKKWERNPATKIVGNSKVKKLLKQIDKEAKGEDKQ